MRRVTKTLPSAFDNLKLLPDTETVTPQVRAKWEKIANCIFDVLVESTGGPEEAYIILQSLIHRFEENYGIRGGFIVESKEA